METHHQGGGGCGEGYTVLTEETVAYWAWALGEARAMLGGLSPKEWQVTEVGDGNLNLVFILRGPRGSLVVKQALPYVRCVGTSWPLSARRAWFEWEGLKEQHRHAPDRVPEPIHYDPTHHALAMSFLSPHVILRRGIVEGVMYPRAAEHLGEFLARSLYATSVYKSRPAAGHQAEVWKHQRELFALNHMHTITEELFFVDPFCESPRNRWTTPHLDAVVVELRQDGPLRMKANELRHRFLTHKEALLHGDLHTGSVMVCPDDTRVIDPEFAWFGPIGFDVGLLIGNLLLGFFSQTGHAGGRGPPRQGYERWLLQLIRALWDHFVDHFLGLWAQDRGTSDSERTLASDVVARVWIDTLNFAGSAIIRRIVGLAHALELETIADVNVRAQCECRALALGKEMMRGEEGMNFPTALRSVDALCLRALELNQRE